jgi:ferredoxin
MVKYGMLSLISSPASQVSVDRSRCLRMRFNRSSCAKCASACPGGAIAFEGGISIDEVKCIGCMLCTSACPVDALEITGFDFTRAVAELRKAENPVLGCMHKEGLLAHAKMPCLGFLSLEHLLFLLSFADGMVQLNLTECRECENGLVTDTLDRVFEAGHKMLPDAALRLRPVHEKDELEFQDISLSRRGFFRLLSGSAVEGVSSVVGELNRTGKSLPYGSKKVPDKRELLNRAWRQSDAVNRGLLACYFTAEVDDSCNACAKCAAVCPSGALKRSREGETKVLLFNASCCSGCGLCEEFCMHNALKLRGGHEGNNLMEFVSVKLFIEQRHEE